MTAEKNFLDFFFSNLPKIFYPEQLIQMDIALSKIELLAMLVVDRHGEMIMSQLAESINIPLSTTTGLVNRLVKNAYVKRERSEADRRIVALQLTEKGQGIVNQLKEIIFSYLDRVDSILTPEEKNTLFGVLTKILDALSPSESTVSSEHTGPDIREIRIE